MGKCTKISIHAPREGCDKPILIVFCHAGAISIHAPREGCDQEPIQRITDYLKFQSTHPVRGATIIFFTFLEPKENISIHAPREGCDHCFRLIITQGAYFNPRTP